jgi:hypothetical protein
VKGPQAVVAKRKLLLPVLIIMILTPITVFSEYL